MSVVLRDLSLDAKYCSYITGLIALVHTYITVYVHCGAPCVLFSWTATSNLILGRSTTVQCSTGYVQSTECLWLSAPATSLAVVFSACVLLTSCSSCLLLSPNATVWSKANWLTQLLFPSYKLPNIIMIIAFIVCLNADAFYKSVEMKFSRH